MNAPRANTRSYFGILLAGLLLLVVAGAFDVLVDPYLIYRSPRIEGVNRWKTRFFFGQYQSKPRLAAAAAPRHVVLGTSTAGGSLRPDHPAFRGEPVFNYALAGSAPHLQSLALTQAANGRRLASVIVCVDFFAYNAFMDQRAFRQFEQSVEPGESLGARWRRTRRALELLSGKAFNYHSLVDSLATVSEQTKPGAGGLFRDIRDDGFWQNPRPAGWPQLSLFTTIERQYLSSGWFPEPARRFAFSDGKGRSSLAGLEQILDTARGSGVEVSIAIMPFHARLAEAMHEAGLWGEFEALKRLVFALSRQPRFGGAVRVWDFSGYTTITMDPVRGAPQETPWFEDSIHPSVATGDLMLARMLGRDDPRDVPPDFGRLLEATTLDAQLHAATERRAQYRAANPADVEQVRAIAQQTAAARRPPFEGG